jgi:hypothetical protein
VRRDDGWRTVEDTGGLERIDEAAGFLAAGAWTYSSSFISLNFSSTVAAIVTSYDG